MQAIVIAQFEGERPEINSISMGAKKYFPRRIGSAVSEWTTHEHWAAIGIGAGSPTVQNWMENIFGSVQ